jgi:hypothetical protein
MGVWEAKEAPDNGTKESLKETKPLKNQAPLNSTPHSTTLINFYSINPKHTHLKFL